MTSELWFYLDQALEAAEHACAASVFDLRDRDAVDEPAFVLVAGDGIGLRSNGLPGGKVGDAPEPVYAQGAPATAATRPHADAENDAVDEVAVFLPIRPRERASILAAMRQALRDGQQWLVIAVDDSDRILLYPRRTLDAVVNTNARWVAASVQVYGILGPYPAVVADGYRCQGWLVARFTRPVADQIVADAAGIIGRADPGSGDRVRWRGDTIEVVSGRDGGEPTVVAPDADGRYTLAGLAWCWEKHPGLPSAAADAPTGTRAEPVCCLCPRRCLLCDQPVGAPHELDCVWQRGSAEGERPCLPRQPLVADRTVHRPGCRQARHHPGGLFEQITPEGDLRCLICGAINTADIEAIPSFGGTTEHFHRCTACHAQWGWCDMEAVR